MKKIIALALASLSIVSVMAACGGKTGPCDSCGKEAELTKVEAYGETGYLCDTCKSLFDIGMEAIDSGLVDLEDYM